MTHATDRTAGANWKRRFFPIWGAQAFSLVGSSLVQFALVWWLTKTTGSATVLATASLAAILPQVVVMPLAGALIDRWNRRVIMILADAIIALVTVALIVLSLTGHLAIWHVYVAMFLRAALGGFHWTAMAASTSLMVPGEQLARIAGMNQTLQGVMSIVAPPIGALMMAALPLHSVLLVDVVTAALAIAPLFFFRIPQPVKAATGAPGAAQSSVLGDVRAGLQYLKSWPGLLAILVVAMIINLLVFPAISLMPILVTKHFGGGALELGWLESAWGIGVVLGGITLSAWGGFKRKVVTSMTSMVFMGLGLLVMGLAPAAVFALAIAGMFFSGFMNPMLNGPFFALLQTKVAPEMQGRIFSLVHAGTALMMPFGLLVAGPVADAFGVQTWYLIGGGATMLLGLVSFLIPVIMNVEENARPLVAGGLDRVPAPLAAD